VSDTFRDSLKVTGQIRNAAGRRKAWVGKGGKGHGGTKHGGDLRLEGPSLPPSLPTHILVFHHLSGV
jgi:hypothetical protein